jgi:hypothetical protein
VQGPKDRAEGRVARAKVHYNLSFLVLCSLFLTATSCGYMQASGQDVVF